MRTGEEVLREFGLSGGLPGLAAYYPGALRMAAAFAALEARAETRVQPVAWWIGPHDGLLAGATTNKNLADARIEHGATVRPLVFGDVAPSAESGVTFLMARRAESAYDAWVSQKDLSAEHTLCNPEAMRFALEAALTGGESA